MEYILHCCCTSLLQVRDSLHQTQRHSQELKEMMTIPLERQEYLRATHLPQQTCSLAMAVGSKL